MMKKGTFIAGLSICMLVTILTLSFMPSGVFAKEKIYEVNFQLFHNRLQGLVQQVHLPFAKRLEEKSGGRLKVIVNDWASISPEVTSALESNLIQMAIYACFLEPGQHDIIENIAGVPMLYSSSTAASLTTQYIYEKYPEVQAQFSPDIKVASWFCASMMQLSSTKKQVKSLEDMKGLKVVALGKTQVMTIGALGGIPTTIPMTTPGDLYVSLERGMGEGVIFDLGSLITNKINEVAKYTTLSNLSTGPMYLAISRQWYNSLPKDLQSIIDKETGSSFSELNGRFEDKALIENGLQLKKIGQSFYLPPDDEMDRWRENCKKVLEDTISEMEGKGVKNARIIFEDAVNHGNELTKKYGEVDVSPLIK